MFTTVEQKQYFVEHCDKVVPHYLGTEYNKRYFLLVDSQSNSPLYEQGPGTESSCQEGERTHLLV